MIPKDGWGGGGGLDLKVTGRWKRNFLGFGILRFWGGGGGRDFDQNFFEAVGVWPHETYLAVWGYRKGHVFLWRDLVIYSWVITLPYVFTCSSLTPFLCAPPCGYILVPPLTLQYYTNTIVRTIQQLTT